MTADPILWLLQANDSQYPSGAYAHSLGLEELVEAGVVQSAADLEKFLGTQVVPALLAFEIPFFTAAHDAATHDNIEALRQLDAELDAWRLAAETRHASRTMGSRRLELLRKLDDAAFVAAYAEPTTPCHHLVVSAIETRGLPLRLAARAFVFQSLSGFCYASMKLIRIGQSVCQQILRTLLSQIGQQIDKALDQSVQGWFNPLLEIASLRHARAPARLFIS